MLRLKAHAKVNLGLSILEKRGDGFHELDTLFARLELHDTLVLEPRPAGLELQVEGANLPNDNRNLAFRAAQLYLQRAGVGVGGVRLRLRKRIPIAAGLGGGSSNAAAVLRGLVQLYPAGVDVLELAQRLGSDVPFFVRDLSAARGRGRGEKLEPVTLPELHLVLVNPGVPVSTKDAYAHLRMFGSPLEVQTLLSSLQEGAEPGYPNTLQAGVLPLEPTIGNVLTRLRATPLRGVVMSGSGSSCFGIARNEAEACAVAAALQTEHTAWWVRATKTV